jgi:hypothetical protein
MPEETHVVYFDDVEVDAADRVPQQGGLPRIYRHNVRLELYEPTPDDAAEAAIEAALDAAGLPWSKEDRYWLPDANRYQVLYEIFYITKTL